MLQNCYRNGARAEVKVHTHTHRHRVPVSQSQSQSHSVRQLVAAASRSRRWRPRHGVVSSGHGVGGSCAAADGRTGGGGSGCALVEALVGGAVWCSPGLRAPGRGPPKVCLCCDQTPRFAGLARCGARPELQSVQYGQRSDRARRAQ